MRFTINTPWHGDRSVCSFEREAIGYAPPYNVTSRQVVVDGQTITERVSTWDQSSTWDRDGFTFGPLHFYHFTTATSPLGIFAAIFLAGLYFAVLFQRSGNLWIIGIMHGIADWYILSGR